MLAKLLTDVGFISQNIILCGAKWFQNHSSSRAGCVITTVYLTARNSLCCLYSEIQSVSAVSLIFVSRLLLHGVGMVLRFSVWRGTQIIYQLVENGYYFITFNAPREATWMFWWYYLSMMMDLSCFWNNVELWLMNRCFFCLKVLAEITQREAVRAHVYQFLSRTTPLFGNDYGTWNLSLKNYNYITTILNGVKALNWHWTYQIC